MSSGAPVISLPAWLIILILVVPVPTILAYFFCLYQIAWDTSDANHFTFRIPLGWHAFGFESSAQLIQIVDGMSDGAKLYHQVFEVISALAVSPWVPVFFYNMNALLWSLLWILLAWFEKLCIFLMLARTFEGMALLVTVLVPLKWLLLGVLFASVGIRYIVRIYCRERQENKKSD